MKLYVVHYMNKVAVMMCLIIMAKDEHEARSFLAKVEEDYDVLAVDERQNGFTIFKGEQVI